MLKVKQGLIIAEIAWHKGHAGESGKGEEYEAGFIAGLEKALFLLRSSPILIVRQAIDTDTINCPRCEGTGTYYRLGDTQKICSLCHGTGKFKS